MPTPTRPATHRRRIAVVLAAALATGAAASAGSIFSLAPNPDLAVAAGISTPGLHYRYGESVALGDGRARTYVVVDGMTGGPVEVGIALTEAALEGLPEHSPDHGPGTHGAYSEYLLELPAHNPTPYRFVELDWNPHGHGGPHTAPHFDFHFYRVPLSVRNEIDLKAPDFEARAARLPSAEELPAGYVSTHVLLNTTPAGMTVPRMGLHWVDPASPELPPQSKPFTTTFIVGTWDGQVVFDEPMITREFLLAHRAGQADADSMPIPVTRRYARPGHYPTSYGITWDERQREYRVALTGLTRNY